MPNPNTYLDCSLCSGQAPCPSSLSCRARQPKPKLTSLSRLHGRETTGLAWRTRRRTDPDMIWCVLSLPLNPRTAERGAHIAYRRSYTAQAACSSLPPSTPESQTPSLCNEIHPLPLHRPRNGATIFAGLIVRFALPIRQPTPSPQCFPRCEATVMPATKTTQQ